MDPVDRRPLAGLVVVNDSMVGITTLGAGYRVRVESYDAIAVGTGDGAPASPPSR